jgi:uncharacterized protein
MRQSTPLLVEHVKWSTKLSRRVLDFVRKNVPNPRDNPVTERPISEAKHEKMYEGGFKVGPRPGERIDTYMQKRDSQWIADQKQRLREQLDAGKLDTPRHADGTPFAVPIGGRDQYITMEAHSQLLKEPEIKDYQVEDERILLRRQLQLDNELEYRKFIAESKKTELAVHKAQKQHFQHASDKSYDPFKGMKGYRPQDSVALAQWLKRQQATGESVSGLSLKTKEGQDRFYNESRMATQYAANPFSTRIELPAAVRQMVPTAYTPDSVFINDKEVIGSGIITQGSYYHWNVSSFDDINERTCALLLHLYPVPDIVFIGTGRNQYMIDEELKIKFMQRGSIVHCMPTGHALAHYMQVVSLSRRCAIAYINAVPTNAYNTECFGDFIENDSYCLSDSQLGIAPNQMHLPIDRFCSKIPEKYRDMQGSGYGPRYMETSDGRLVRPGTYGTRLHPLLEPGHEPIEWEKLPSYYNWYPKENLHDYIENTTYREVKGKKVGDPAERRALEASYPKDGKNVLKGPHHETPPVVEVAPWESTSLPVTKFMYEKFDDEVYVEDWKSGRVVGMDKESYEKYKVMMAERKAGQPESEPIEFDQERYVADKHGIVYDLTQIKFRPIFEGRWNPQRATSRGFGSMKKLPT